MKSNKICDGLGDYFDSLLQCSIRKLSKNSVKLAVLKEVLSPGGSQTGGGRDRGFPRLGNPMVEELVIIELGNMASNYL